MFFNFVRSHGSFLTFRLIPRLFGGVPSKLSSLSSDDINCNASGEVKIWFALSLSLSDKGAFSRVLRRFSSFYQGKQEKKQSVVLFFFMELVIFLGQIA